MKNNRRRNIFDAIFGDRDFFGESLFSMSSDNMSFPEEGDPNFHKSEEIQETDGHFIKRETWVSIDGTQKMERTTSQSKYKAPELREPSKEDLKMLMDQAVANQDFEKAAELRDKIKKLGC
ncbi:MAG: UvrB/UvrC motif-containing protein [Nanoarchaeota archaeon]